MAPRERGVPIRMGRTGLSGSHTPFQRTAEWLIAGLVFAVTAVCFVFWIGKWPLDGDESFTLVDASRPVREILRFQSPIHYLMAHYALRCPLPIEAALRLPAALSAALVAPSLFLMLPRRLGAARWYSALAVLACPWIFELSQFGRHYTPMFLFAVLAVASLYRSLSEQRPRWLAPFAVFTVLAIYTHATATTLALSGPVAAIAYLIQKDRRRFVSWLKRYQLWLISLLCCLMVVGVYAVVHIAPRWFGASRGAFGDHSSIQLVAATLIATGLPVWALAIGPLIKWPTRWSADQAFFAAFVVSSFVPLLVLVNFGGGVSARYCLQAIPGLFVLAGIHWQNISAKLPTVGHHIALAAAVLASCVPGNLSTIRDGNHYDYRAAADFVRGLQLTGPIVASSFKENMIYYLPDRGVELHELGYLRSLPGTPTDATRTGQALLRLIAKAERTGRPLLLVSNEDRMLLDAPVRRWIGERFATIAHFEKPRFDHRRNALYVYEYRPAPRIVSGAMAAADGRMPLGRGGEGGEYD